MHNIRSNYYNSLRNAISSTETLRSDLRGEFSQARLYLEETRARITQTKKELANLDERLQQLKKTLANTIAETNQLLNSTSRVESPSTQSPRNAASPPARHSAPSAPVTSTSANIAPVSIAPPETARTDPSSQDTQLTEIRRRHHERWLETQRSTSNTLPTNPPPPTNIQQRPQGNRQSAIPNPHTVTSRSLFPNAQPAPRIQSEEPAPRPRRVDLGPPGIEEIPDAFEHTNPEPTFLHKPIPFHWPYRPFQHYRTPREFCQLIDYLISKVRDTHFYQTSRYSHATLHRQSQDIADKLIQDLYNIKDTVRINRDVPKAAQRLTDVLNCRYLRVLLPRNNWIFYSLR